MEKNINQNVIVVKKGQKEYCIFSGECWNCNSELMVEENKNKYSVEVKCPECGKFVSLLKPKVEKPRLTFLEKIFGENNSLEY